MINVLSFPRSLLDLTKLRRLSINLTGPDGRLAIKNIPLVARGITTLELPIDCQSGKYHYLNIYCPIEKKSEMKHINQKQGFPAKADYDICNTLNFPNLRSLLISTSYNRHKRPIRHLATFLSKSDDSTPSTLEELKILFRHDVQALRHEKSPHDTMHMFQHKD